MMDDHGHMLGDFVVALIIAGIHIAIFLPPMLLIGWWLR